MAFPVATTPALVVAAVLIASTAPVRAEPSDVYVETLVASARAQRLAETRDWQVLLHYQRGPLGGWKSQADGLGFFLAGKKGRRDPAAELEATVRALAADAPAGNEHAQCRFPARWQWLKRTLSIDAARIPDRRCPDLETWRTGIAAEAVTLVYATAYLNSPASMYGHTFLRLTRATGEGNPLLDYVVNFAADVDTENGIIYSFKGVSGLFPGRFYVMPFYVKVQEYSNLESRDLWEYQLSLTPEQVHRLVLHAWETRTTHFDYYFLSRNCSYHLLSLLEVADPSLHLMEAMSGFVIPSDTVRLTLAQPGLVRSVSARPSLRTVMTERKAVLSGPEVKAAEDWATAPPGAPPPPLDAPGQALAKERQALIIDAAYDFMRFREGIKADPSDGFKRRERRMLLARGALGVPPQEVVTKPIIDAPERGHETFRLSLGGGASDEGGAFGTLGARLAIHDYLDAPGGYPPDARLQMGELRLRYAERTRGLRVDRADIIDIVSAAPLDRWARSPSWKVWLGADNARETGCERAGSTHAGWRCLYAGVLTGGGFAVRFGPRRSLLLLLLAETELAAGPAFSDAGSYRIGGGGEALLVGGVGQRWRFELGTRYAYYFLGDRRSVLRARVGQSLMITRRFALRLGAETAGPYAQAAADLMVYF